MEASRLVKKTVRFVKVASLFYKDRTCLVQNSVLNGGWWIMAENPNKHTIAAYDGTMAGIPSQNSYGGCQKTCHSLYLTILVQKAHRLVH
ncbi:hypothetical protein MTR_5g072910 [Medicago truncatula]|uniref:Uncharacterized protein n=1 Tax=Medicago truncatula TaxID=3880 RepID=G7KEE2_MEDTR|nr:hypothetical protein MTR_5g072910 [Medicago truncatula]